MKSKDIEDVIKDLEIGENTVWGIVSNGFQLNIIAIDDEMSGYYPNKTIHNISDYDFSNHCEFFIEIRDLICNNCDAIVFDNDDGDVMLCSDTHDSYQPYCTFSNYYHSDSIDSIF